jgi:hypothetical protein
VSRDMGYPQEFPNYNEAGEPLISGEALRLEQSIDSDPSNWFCDECGCNHYGRCRDYDEDD